MTPDSKASRSPSQDTGHDAAPQDEPKQPWEAPAIVWHAPISSHTKGVQHNFGDGFNNLS